MAGTKAGGLLAAKKNKEKHGEDFYVRLGRIGGSVKRPESRYFSLNPEAAKEAGQRGGLSSARRWTKEERKIQSRRMKRYWANQEFQEGFNQPTLVDKWKAKLGV